MSEFELNKKRHQAAEFADKQLKEEYTDIFDVEWTDEMNSRWLVIYWKEYHRLNQED